MRRYIVMAPALALLFCGMCVVENSAVGLRPEEPPTRSTSSLYALAGEFRVVFANLLWTKAEQYHHEYLLRHNQWSANKELIGLLDLITALDPHFVEAYAAGTYIYADGYRNMPRALRYLRDGIANNPRSWELHQLAALFYARRMQDPGRAIPYARLAVRYCDDEDQRKIMMRLLRTVEDMAAEPRGGSADRMRINAPSGLSQRPH